jgi:[protein-PII] uridylyltransferase
MLSLLQTIEADAAQQLVLPPGRHPTQEINRYKNFLKVETHRLKMRHRAGAGGRLICQARAGVLDVLVRHMMQEVLSPPAGGAEGPSVAVIAIGGYGRGELNPFSDLDVMFLHDGTGVFQGKPNACLESVMKGVLYPLWDIGLKVGHSVRSIDDCVKIANSDMQSKTALIEARLITGDDRLFRAMQDVVEARCVQGFEDSYIAARLADQAARRAKFGDSACMQEPNIKNGCGGLRDYQNLLWMAFFKYRIHSLAELEARGQLSQTEREQLEAAYDFLLRVRNDLHYHANRATDTLTRSVQPSIAHNLGFTDRSIVRRIEVFMRILYTHLRQIYLITRTLEQRLALMPQTQRRLSLRQWFRSRKSKTPPPLFDGFVFKDGEIHPGSEHVFQEQPRRLMRVFLYAQQRGFKLHPDLAQMIRNELSLVTKSFMQDSHVRETFLEILSQRGNVSPVLRPMHETGLLGRYLPEFGRLTCLVQHEFFHRYTADEHTMICLEMLDRVWHADTPPYDHFAELFKKIEQPYILYLALLLHDSGRAGHSRKHTEGSLRSATQVAQRLALDSSAAQTLRLIIELHLAMIQISQRRDLDDPVVVRKFADQVKIPDNLNLLLLHTFADSLGTSAELWNDFKESLLWTLYDRTMQRLQGTPDVDRELDKQRTVLANAVRKMMPRYVGEDELEAHVAHLPARYFRVHSAQEILADVMLVNRFMQGQSHPEKSALEPAMAWQDEPDRGYAAASICTRDRPGLFSKFAGTFTASGMNIYSAKIFSRTDGIVIDTFFVTDAQSGGLPNREAREKSEKLLRQVLTSQIDLDATIARVKRGRPIWLYEASEPLPTEIHFDNSSSDTHTIIDVETADRVGLLHAISRVMSELQLDIALAKICTEKGAVMDSFYITEVKGGKIQAPEHQQKIENRIRSAIGGLDALSPPTSEAAE